MACEVCDSVSEELDIPTPGIYFQCLEAARTLIAEQKLSVVRASCELSEITPDRPWPSDILEHEFKCTGCPRRYVLWVDTYHGTGSWKVA